MKANGSRREEKGGKNITEKIRCVPRSGAERKTVGRASGVVGGGGWWRSMRGAGAWAGDACANLPPAGGRAVPRRRRPHSQRHRRSSLVARVPSAAHSAPPPLRPRRRRPAPRD
ncbi:unnamed protein product [Arctia plantaginis]|uniref:Uncharacterized protein n=1 Tax=Arctia plantaginis TaxID=874455 RepID=A0A8S1A9I4_ARCPL|nr:unnamed protein product [Arctia plantaginis]CAB3241989.1 unnamed protein product [Arctia plantaginis]